MGVNYDDDFMMETANHFDLSEEEVDEDVDAADSDDEEGDDDEDSYDDTETF